MATREQIMASQWTDILSAAAEARMLASMTPQERQVYEEHR